MQRAYDDRYDEDGEEREMRTARITSREGDKMARQAAMHLCARTLKIICDEGLEIDAAFSKALAEAEEKQEEQKQAEALEKAAQIAVQEEEMVSSVAACVGDLFGRDSIREALVNENWSVDRASDRLFNERCNSEDTVKPMLNMQRLLAAAREAKAKKQMDNDSMPSAAVLHKGRTKPVSSLRKMS